MKDHTGADSVQLQRHDSWKNDQTESQLLEKSHAENSRKVTFLITSANEENNRMNSICMGTQQMRIGQSNSDGVMNIININSGASVNLTINSRTS